MPGIVGIVSRRPAAECADLVEQMIGSMMHEPFYRSGTIADENLGVFGGWVALAESSAAANSTASDRGGICLAFSGECHQETNEPLAKQFEENGDEGVERLNGLFAGLVIDRRRRSAWLFNDRFGFDRVYVAETDGELYFASEAKALLAVLPQTRAFDAEGLADFLSFGCTVDGRTLFRGINLLPAGSCWQLAPEGVRKRRYFQVADWEKQEPLRDGDLPSALAETLERIAPRYYASANEALGLSLTAGLDSRVVIAARPALCKHPCCYTYDGPRGETADTRQAREVAAAAGCEHRVLRLGADFFDDFGAHADRTVFLTDGAFGPAGAHELYLSRAARQIAPVRLTGVFGGEVFRGVSTFHRNELASRLLESALASQVAARQRHLPTEGDHPVTAAVMKEIPWSIFGSVAACRSQLNFRTPFLDNEMVRLAFRIPPRLRGSVSAAFASFVAQKTPHLAAIATDMGALGSDGARRLGRRAVAKVTFKLEYWLNDGMPDWLSRVSSMVDKPARMVLGRHKYLRYRHWFQNELSGYLKAATAAVAQRGDGIWQADVFQELVAAHLSGRGNYVQEINAVLTLEAVERLLFSSSAKTRNTREEITLAPVAEASH